MSIGLAFLLVWHKIYATTIVGVHLIGSHGAVYKINTGIISPEYRTIELVSSVDRNSYRDWIFFSLDFSAPCDVQKIIFQEQGGNNPYVIWH